MDSDHIVVAAIIIPVVLYAKYSKQLSYFASEEFQRIALVNGLAVVLAVAGAALLLAGAVHVGRNVVAVRRSVREQAAGLASARAGLDQASAENRRLQEELGDARGEIGSLTAELDGFRRREAKREVKQEPFHLTMTGEQPLYRLAGLAEHDVEYLLGQGYAEHSIVDLDSPGPKAWLLKGSSRESPEHFFLVHRIAEHLRTKSEKVVLFETRGPDIVFTSADGKLVALEIESGSWLRKDKKGFLEKVSQLNERYGTDWAFVVSVSKLKFSYQPYGKVFTRRSIFEFLDRYFA